MGAEEHKTIEKERIYRTFIIIIIYRTYYLQDALFKRSQRLKSSRAEESTHLFGSVLTQSLLTSSTLVKLNTYWLTWTT